MVTVEFYVFTKERNNAKHPKLPIKTLECELKAPTSILSPVLILDNTEMLNPFFWNYARILQFGRYYYIEDWTFDGNKLVCKLSVDVLATYRQQILTSTQNVARHGNKTNDDVVDTQIKPFGAPNFQTQIMNSLLHKDYDNGFYVVDIINGDKNHVGATTSYMFNADGFHNLLSKVFNVGSYNTNLSVDSATLAAVYNPLQYITRCMYIPINGGLFQGEEITELWVGWHKYTGIYNCFRLKMSYETMNHPVTFAVPKHPKTYMYTKTINLDPISHYELDIQPFGLFVLDSSKLIDATQIKVQMSIDVFTGNALLQVFAINQVEGQDNLLHILVETECRIAIDIAIAQIGKNEYAIKTAVAQANANVINAKYEFNLLASLQGAIEGASSGKLNSGNMVAPGIWKLPKQDLTGIKNDLLARANGTYIPKTTNFDIFAGLKNAIGGAVSGFMNTPLHQANVSAAKAAGAEAIMMAQQPTASVAGINAGGVVFNRNWELRFTYYDCQNVAVSEIGNAYMKRENLSYILNYDADCYIQTLNARFENNHFAGAFPIEIETITNMLNTGVIF